MTNLPQCLKLLFFGFTSSFSFPDIPGFTEKSKHFSFVFRQTQKPRLLSHRYPWDHRKQNPSFSLGFTNISLSSHRKPSSSPLGITQISMRSPETRAPCVSHRYPWDRTGTRAPLTRIQADIPGIAQKPKLLSFDSHGYSCAYTESRIPWDSHRCSWAQAETRASLLGIHTCRYPRTHTET